MKLLLGLFSFFTCLPLCASPPGINEPENPTKKTTTELVKSFETERFRVSQLRYNGTDDALRSIVDESRYEELIERQLEFVVDLPCKASTEISEINTNVFLRYSEKWKIIKTILSDNGVDVVTEYLGSMDGTPKGRKLREYHKYLAYGLGEFLVFDKQTGEVAGWINLSQDLNFGGYSEFYIQVRPGFRGGAGNEIYTGVKKYVDSFVGSQIETPDGKGDFLGAFAVIRTDNIASKKAAEKAGWIHFNFTAPEKAATCSGNSFSEENSSEESSDSSLETSSSEESSDSSLETSSSEESSDSSLETSSSEESSDSSSERELYDSNSYYYFTSIADEELLNNMFQLHVED